jgi:hypothetical protein
VNLLPALPRSISPQDVVVSPRLRLRLLDARRRFQAGGRFHLLALAVVVLAACAFSLRAGRQLEGERAALLAAAASERAALTPRQASFLERAEGWIVAEASGAYAGDHVDPELAAPGALDAWLARPGVYLRGVAPELARADGLARASRGSFKDGVVLCLLDPPAAPGGQAMLDKVSRTYLRGALFEEKTARVRPLREAEDALRVLTPAWSAEVRAADASLWMRRLGLEMRQRSAGVKVAGQIAASAAYLLVVVDEVPAGVRVPEVGPAITDHQRESVLPVVEERAHEARLALIDLEANRVLLRVRRALDASKLGVAGHAVYTQALQGCALGAEARAAAK